MLVVAAIGGNALLRRGERADADTQRANVAIAADALVEIATEHRLVITHGNGPQVGLLALQAEAYEPVRPYPLDVLGAESEGMIGYMLEQALENRLAAARVATLLTQVVVDAADPAFAHPTKPVGPVYERADAVQLAAERGWSIAPDGPSWRRVVPSPEPRRIVELEAIRTLLDAGLTVVCVGGGGVPVTADPAGRLRGVEAVIDKDLAAAMLATELGADALLLLTDVAAIELDWGTPAARPIAAIGADELLGLGLATGSMGPKAEAASRFANGTGGIAAIGALADAPAILCGAAGTRVLPADADGQPELTDGASGSQAPTRTASQNSKPASRERRIGQVRATRSSR
jgi:carbamate kinase